MPDLFDSVTLTNLVAPHLGIDPSLLRLSPIRTGKHNSSYWVDGGEARLVLRVAPPDDAGLLFYEVRMMRQEPELHTLIREGTGLPVAAVVAYDFSRQVIDRDWLLMTGLPGVPLSEAENLTPTQRARTLQQVGERLRALHALTAPQCLGRTAYGYLGAHHPMAEAPTWSAAFHAMWNRLLDDVVASGCYSPREGQAFRDLLARHARHFDRPVASRLLHMDIWSQNILVDEDGHVTGLVDFDRAVWGDAEIEFAILDYTGISEPPFWAGYDVERDVSPSAEIRRLFYLLYEVQKYMPISVWRRDDPQRALHFKRQSLALAAGLGL